MSYRVGIIGGQGNMGSCFKSFFERAGCDVQVSDVKTVLSNKEIAKSSDIVVISVPINKTLNVIKEIGPHIKEGSLLMDLTSLKEKEVKTMLKYSKIEVIGGHPVFGPVDKFEKQVMVLCPARGNTWLPILKNMLHKQGALVKITSPKEHDKIMAVIQGLTHFSSIAMCHGIANLGVNVEEYLEYVSPVYKMRMSSLGRILAQDPSLYADIELSNPFVKKVARQMKESVDKLYEHIKNKDRERFISFFTETAESLGDFPSKAQKDSDKIISLMGDQK